ncbi:unnamed protein product [Arctogadus glacialis]
MQENLGEESIQSGESPQTGRLAESGGCCLGLMSRQSVRIPPSVCCLVHSWRYREQRQRPWDVSNSITTPQTGLTLPVVSEDHVVLNTHSGHINTPTHSQCFGRESFLKSQERK